METYLFSINIFGIYQVDIVAKTELFSPYESASWKQSKIRTLIAFFCGGLTHSCYGYRFNSLAGKQHFDFLSPCVDGEISSDDIPF